MSSAVLATVLSQYEHHNHYLPYPFYSMHGFPRVPLCQQDDWKTGLVPQKTPNVYMLTI